MEVKSIKNDSIASIFLKLYQKSLNYFIFVHFIFVSVMNAKKYREHEPFVTFVRQFNAFQTVEIVGKNVNMKRIQHMALKQSKEFVIFA